MLSSPSVRNEYYLYVHNALRLILSSIQEFGSLLKSAQLAENLAALQTTCRSLILDDEIPMDPRTNSGIILAYLAKLSDDYENFIQTAKCTNNAQEIALCVGVINTFDHHDFQLYCSHIRDVCGKIEELANSNATVPSILLCATRSLYQISKMLLSFDWSSSLKVCSNDAKLILRKLLIFTFAYLEHHMDSVRHICRDTLRNVVAAAQKLQFEFLIQKIYDACNSERLSLSMKCIVLQQAVDVLGAETILKNCPSLFESIFAKHLGHDFVVNNLFEGRYA